MESLTQTAETKPTDLMSLTAEIKIYVQQWGQNTIEIGKRLIAAKKLVAHGEWSKWLEDNFNFGQSAANKFMKCAERFGNSESIPNLNSTQMIQLLSLPEGETEKFIDAKKAEGKPVEDMTVKNLREEVAKYKAEIEQEKAKTENLFSEAEKLCSEVEQVKAEKTALEDDKKRLNEERDKMQKQLVEVAEKSATLQSENAKLQEQLKNQKPIEKMVAPEDYEPTKAERDELQVKIAELEKKLKEKPIEVKNTAELEKAQKDLAELQAKLAETTTRAEIFQKIDTVCLLWKDIFQSKIGSVIFAEYEKIKPNRYNEFVGSVSDFFKNNGIL